MSDNVNHPTHYKAFGVEVIDITEHLNFCRGNAVKYLCRAGLKNSSTELEDLRKAQWYINREIDRMEKNNPDLSTGAEEPFPAPGGVLETIAPPDCGMQAPFDDF